jgi:hypothetical protein
MNKLSVDNFELLLKEPAFKQLMIQWITIAKEAGVQFYSPGGSQARKFISWFNNYPNSEMSSSLNYEGKNKKLYEEILQLLVSIQN